MGQLIQRENTDANKPSEEGPQSYSGAATRAAKDNGRPELTVDQLWSLPIT